MDISSAEWLSELAMEDQTLNDNEYPMSPLYYPIDDIDFVSFPSKSYTVNELGANYLQPPQKLGHGSIDTFLTSFERPEKQPKTESWNPCTTSHQINPKPPSSHSSRIISFQTHDSAPATSQQLYGVGSSVKIKSEKPNGSVNLSSFISQSSSKDPYGAKYNVQDSNRVGATSRSPLHSQDHVIAERKRREKISQLLIALSAVVPGLKKMDKASVLGNAVNYLKYLQERVKTLEEQVAEKTMESVVFVKKSQVLCGEDESFSTADNSDDCCIEQPLPGIETRVSNKDVLVRVHCESQKGCLTKILSEIEKLHLNVINTSVLPFGSSTLDVTVIAQMDAEFSLTVKDLVRNLRQALR